MMDDRALFSILRYAESTDGQVGRSGMLKLLLGCDPRKLVKLKLDHLNELCRRRNFVIRAERIGRESLCGFTRK